jgi:hypothetical protein
MSAFAAVNRADFVAALTAATAAPLASGAPGAISAEIAIKRDADELLAPFTVAIAVRNSTPRPIALDFPTADMYRIDVRRDGEIVWSTATGHKPLLIARRVDVPPGLTRLASQIVDGTTDDRRAFAPGQYVVHVALLGATLTTALDATIAFSPPISISAARAAAGGTVVTIAGSPEIEAGAFGLRDASGSLRLSRPLGLRPAGSYVVRGSLDAVRDGDEFAVWRFAPAFENHSMAGGAGPASRGDGAAALASAQTAGLRLS